MAVKRTRIGFLLQPWAGLFGGVAGWVLHHQLVNDVLHFDCGRGNATGLVLGAAVIACIALLGLWSWRALRTSDAARHEREDDSRSGDTRSFAAKLSLMAAALFALLVAVQTLAGAMVPGCPP